MRLQWGKDSERFYESGIDRMVLYPRRGGNYLPGVAWNGVTALNERPSGAESSFIFANNEKYINLRSVEDFGCTLEAYTYPEEFGPCIGRLSLVPGLYLRQQKNKSFGICYRTLIGNDEDELDHGYKINIVYGCEASPSEKSNQTTNDSPEAITYSWELSSKPVELGNGFRPTAHLIIDSTKTSKESLKIIEDILYGTDGVQPRILMPTEVFSILGSINIYFDDVSLVFEGNLGNKVKRLPDGAVYISPEFVLSITNSTICLKGE